MFYSTQLFKSKQMTQINDAVTSDVLEVKPTEERHVKMMIHMKEGHVCLFLTKDKYNL